MEKPKPEIKGFGLSTDYEKLWELINEGHRIPAWLIYTTTSEGHIFWDIVEVKKWPDSRYMIGYRGCGFEGFKDTLEDFCRVCEKCSLHYISPILAE